MDRAQDSNLSPFFEDLSQYQTLSEIKQPLKVRKFQNSTPQLLWAKSYFIKNNKEYSRRKLIPKNYSVISYAKYIKLPMQNKHKYVVNSKKLCLSFYQGNVGRVKLRRY